MTEAGSSALKLVDEQVQQNIRFFGAILSNFQPEPKSSEPVNGVTPANKEKLS